jgi:ankyrin repeat protein
MGSLRSLRRRQVEPVIIPTPSDSELITVVELNMDKRVKSLLERGANPNTPNEKTTILGTAIVQSRVKLVRLLINYGANVRYSNGSGCTLLHYAAACTGLKSACEISHLLLDQGADANAVDYRGWTPLMYAILFKPNADLVEILLDRGADATIRNNDGKKALDLVGRNKHTAALKALLEPVS